MARLAENNLNCFTVNMSDCSLEATLTQTVVASPVQNILMYGKCEFLCVETFSLVLLLFMCFQKLKAFEGDIGVRFNHIRLMAKAFTHKNVGYNLLTM